MSSELVALVDELITQVERGTAQPSLVRQINVMAAERGYRDNLNGGLLADPLLCDPTACECVRLMDESFAGPLPRLRIWRERIGMPAAPVLMDPEVEWSEPMSKRDMARRLFADPNARGRKMEPLLDRWECTLIAPGKRLYRVRLDLMDSASRAKIEKSKNP